jgi:hypothetical protein
MRAKSSASLRKGALANADRNIPAIEEAELGRKPMKAPMGKLSNRHETAKRLSGLDAAAKVLTQSKQPLNATAIAERAVAAGWKTKGKTPHATLHAAMIREITAKGRESRFKKTGRGLFIAAPTAKSA